MLPKKKSRLTRHASTHQKDKRTEIPDLSSGYLHNADRATPRKLTLLSLDIIVYSIYMITQQRDICAKSFPLMSFPKNGKTRFS